MKILSFNKKFWFIISMILIGFGFLLLFLDKRDYNRYLELKKAYVEVQCIVINYDDFERIATIAYSYQNLEYQIEIQTTEYQLMDSFVGVIKPDEPRKLRFDNGYPKVNTYTITAGCLFALSVVFIFIILKNIFVKIYAMKGDKITLDVSNIQSWHNLHRINLIYNNRKYHSEWFRTFENISLVPQKMTVDLYRNKFLYYIDLKSYKKSVF